MRAKLGAKILFVFAVLAQGSLVANLNADTLSVDAYLNLLKQTDPELKEFLVKKDQLQFFVDKENPESALQLYMDTELGFGDDDKDTKSFQAALSKDFPSSGTQVSLRHQRLDNTDRDENINELRIEQDLLKNSFGKNTRLQKDAIVQQASISELESIEALENYLVLKLDTYQNLIFRQQDLAHLNSVLKEFQRLYAYVQEKYQKGAAYSSDLMSVELQVLQIQQSILDAQENLYVEKLTMTSDLKLDDELRVEPWQTKALSEIPLSDIQNLRTFKIAQHYQILGNNYFQMSRDAERPDLTLFGSYSQDDSTRFTNNVDRQEAAVGLSLSWLLGSKKLDAQSAYDEVSYQVYQLSGQTQSADLRLQLDAQVRLLVKLQDELKLVTRKSELAQKLLQENIKRYQRGRIDLDQVISAANDSHDFKRELNALDSNYKKAYVRYLSYNDRLISWLN